MTEQKAIYEAQKQARRADDGRYIVWSPEPFDNDGQHFQVADEIEVDTFFSGCRVVYYVAPDGEVQS
jgi:hypothetical protein